MPNYQDGKVYRLVSAQTPMVYIGSTTLSLTARLAEHRRINRFWERKGQKHGSRSAEILLYPDAKIELLELYPCESGADLRRREGLWIRRFPDTAVNRSIAGRTMEEWRQDNADHIKQYTKAYEAVRNKDPRRQAYMKLYRQESLGLPDTPVARPSSDALPSRGGPDTGLGSAE